MPVLLPSQTVMVNVTKYLFKSQMPIHVSRYCRNLAGHTVSSCCQACLQYIVVFLPRRRDGLVCSYWTGTTCLPPITGHPEVTNSALCFSFSGFSVSSDEES